VESGAVRFTVTPLGVTPGGEAAAARRIAAYLMGKASHPGRPVTGTFPATTTTGGTTGLGTGSGSGRGGGTRSVVGYYRSDQLEGDGWWGGRAAGRFGLSGRVDSRVLESMLAGRDPVTGERLLSARGSAGRGSLKRGEHTRLLNGHPVWDAADAAARFDTNPESLTTALVEVSDDGFMVDDDGGWWLTRTGIDQLARVFDTNPRADHRDVLTVLEALPEEGMVSVSEAARLTGLSKQHFRQVIAEWHQHQGEIEAGLDGRALLYERAWLPAEKHAGRWVIATRDLVEFWRRRTPPAVRVAYDVVATVEKSISILALLSGPDVRAGCVEAVLAANEAGMDWLDTHASKGRRRDGPVDSDGFVRAGFLHATSRALDPHPHVHNLVLNFLTGPDGQGRAVDARHLYQQAKAASAVATAGLRWELTRRWPGLRWRHDERSRVWELEGIPPGLVAEFSTRREEIEAAARRFVGPDGRLPTRTELQEISATTRPAKQTVDAAEVLADWMARAERYGYDPVTVLNPTTRYRPPAAELSRVEREALHRFLSTSEEGVCANDSMFTYADLLAAINRWAPGGQPRPLPPHQLLQEADDYLATTHTLAVHPSPDTTRTVIRRRDGRSNGVLSEQRWTTRRMVHTQVAIVDHWTAGQHADGGLAAIPTTAIDQAAVEFGLDDDQADLLRAWTTSGHRYQAAIGRPGTGKTYTMTAARHLWEAHGWRVIGAAVKGTAAQHLAAETGIPSETIAHHLTAAAHGHPTLDARTILVVDEATTLSDRDLAALLHHARRVGAALRMIGDPHQQQAVAAGGMWAHLTTLHPDDTPELARQRRLQNPDDAHTAELLRAGQIRAAINHLLATGRLRQATDHDHGEQLALAGWLERRQRGIHSPMINRRNHTRRRLNQIAQTILATTGQIGPPHPYPGNTFAVGDRVIATAPDRTLHPDGHPDRYLANGATGTITHTTTSGLTVHFDHLGEITIPANRAHRLDLAYAVTAYTTQGDTYPEAETTATPGEPLPTLYVPLTRGQHANTLIATPRTPTETHQPAAAPARPDPAEELAATITDPTPTPAIVADPTLQRRVHPPRRRRSRRSVRPGRGLAAPDRSSSTSRHRWPLRRRSASLDGCEREAPGNRQP
jgi:conjugative relaxase-like TrwC/TraI family protein